MRGISIEDPLGHDGTCPLVEHQDVDATAAFIFVGFDDLSKKIILKFALAKYDE